MKEFVSPRVHERVAGALDRGRPVVALETAVATHGLPAPHNVVAIEGMEEEIRSRNAEPAVCLVHGGTLHIGAERDLVKEVASAQHRKKASVRDLASSLWREETAGLTVSATLYAARLAGIRVFATGGIGGAHLGWRDTGDVSSDLPQLARTPVITVCSGAKSVLDIPRTLEYLETFGVPVYAYNATEFPAFLLHASGVATDSVSSPLDVAGIARTHWDLGLTSGIVIGNPLPQDRAIDPNRWREWIDRGLDEARDAGISGKEVTPFLLSRIAAYSHGETVTANVNLLLNNAALAADIAVALQL